MPITQSTISILTSRPEISGCAIIIPAHNRRRVTLACLGMLRPLVGEGWSVIVIDDGSTDGTSNAIRQDFPDVTLLEGSGDLFWTGAIELAMRHAVGQGAACCVWLNDDVQVDPDAIRRITRIATEQKCIASAQGKIDPKSAPTWCFPGIKWTKHGLQTFPVDDECKELYDVDACRGNLVAIPLAVIEAIGYPDGSNIPHIGGDTDYTLRATRAGFRCVVDPYAEVFEEENIRTDNRSWLLDDRHPTVIFRQAISKRGSLYPRMLFTYQYRHWGMRGITRAILTYFHLLAILTLKISIPKSLRVRWFAGRSHAYQAYASRDIPS